MLAVPSGTLLGREIKVERSAVRDGIEERLEGRRRRGRGPGVPATSEQMPRQEPSTDPAQGNGPGDERRLVGAQGADFPPAPAVRPAAAQAAVGLARALRRRWR